MRKARRSLVLMVVILVTIFVITVFAQNSTGSLVEDFDDNVMPPNLIISSGNGERVGVNGGRLEIYGPSRTEGNTSWFDTATFTEKNNNFEVEMSIGRGGGQRGGGGIMLWGSRIMYFNIEDVKGTYAFIKSDGPCAWQTIVPRTYSNFLVRGGEKNILKVRKNNDRYTLYINGQQVFDFYDSESYLGNQVRVGMATIVKNGEMVWFDDVKVDVLGVTLDVQCEPITLGKVTSQDGVIDCGENCSKTYDLATSETLSAVPGDSNEFWYWLDLTNGKYYYENPLNLTVGEEKRTIIAHFRTKKIPTLVVPGAMGSYRCGMFKSGCVDEYTWKILGYKFTLGPNWVLDPFDLPGHEPTYASLIQEFIDHGCELEKNLFLVPYNWPKRNRETMNQYLVSAVNNAREKSGWNKVDVVCHSMGCINAVVYVYDTKKPAINKIAMIGPPMRGSAKAYPIWEGGDTSDYKLKFEFLFLNPLIDKMKSAAGYEGVPDYLFIENMIPSIRELLPIDDFLFRKSWGIEITIPVGSMHWKNNLRPVLLDYEGFAKKIKPKNCKIFAGRRIKTLEKIQVKHVTPSPLYAVPKWWDGKPVKRIYAQGEKGDGTVTCTNVKFGKIPVVWRTAEHDKLPDAFRKDVMKFLNSTN